VDQISLGAELTQQILLWKKEGKKIGFVPTMGALHRGHLALIDLSASDCDRTVCSIFVNPTQFNDPSDFEKYPRLVDGDIKLLEDTHCDVVFLPSVKEIYPAGQATEVIDYGAITSSLEAAMRPGHFNGVVAVLRRFFDIVQPDKAYFGEKDFQQLALVKELCRREYPEIEIVPCPIIREESGLAMSSRNQRLSEEGKIKAAKIYAMLQHVAAKRESQGLNLLLSDAVKELEKEGDLRVEYFHVIDAQSFDVLTEYTENARLVIAVWLEGVRLIDNLSLDRHFG
jgi:pantoate--beta-alanine ligase